MEENHSNQERVSEKLVITSPPNNKKSHTIILLIGIGVILLLGLGVYFFAKSTYFQSSMRNNQVEQLSVIPPQTTTQSVSDFNTQTSVLGTIHSDCIEEQINTYIVFSPNGKRVAYSCKTSTGTSVIVKNKKGKEYDEIKDVTFSPDSKHIGYIATVGESYSETSKSFVVVDNQESKQYDYVANLVFNPDSNTVAYAAGSDAYMVNEGDPRGGGDAYTSVKNIFIIVGDKQGKIYEGGEIIVIGNPDYPEDGLYNPVFSSDGKNFVYGAFKNQKRIIVKNNQEFEKYSLQTTPRFVPGTNQLTYTAFMSQDDWYYSRNSITVIRDTEYKGEDTPIFNQKGDVIGSLGGKYGSYHVTINSKRGNTYNDISHITTNMTDQIAYYANQDLIGSSDPNTGSKPVIGSKRFIVVNNSMLDGESTYAAAYSKPVFSPSGKYVAYIVSYISAGDGQLVLYDGNKSQMLEWIQGDLPYIQGIQSFENVTPPVFDPDGNYIGYGLKKGNQLWWYTHRID